jgi:hypothetical protein
VLTAPALAGAAAIYFLRGRDMPLTTEA